MSQTTKEDEEFIALVNRLIRENKSDISNAQKMANIRMLGHALQTRSIQTKQENAATCALLDHYLEQYHELTFLECRNTVQIYREIWNDLSTEHINVANWKSDLDLDSFDFKECTRCGLMGVTENDLKHMFTTTEPDVQHRSSTIDNTRPTSSKTEENSIINPTPTVKQSNTRAFQLKRPTSAMVVPNPPSSASDMDNKTTQNLLKRNEASTSWGNQTYNKPAALIARNEEPVVPLISPKVVDTKQSYTPPFPLKRPNTAVVVPNPPSSTSDMDNKLKKEFRTGLEEYHIQQLLKRNNPSTSRTDQSYNKPVAPIAKSEEPQIQEYGATRKYLGSRLTTKFVPPVRQNPTPEIEEVVVTDDKYKNIDPKMIELIKSEIMDNSSPVAWNDIAGLKYAKTIIQEAVILPMLRPDIFTGLRRPPRGILLFGPPGTGKTLLGKCIASQSKSTFFSISASSLTSKWIGDGEKMVRALFTVAAAHQPAVVFIDEIDSLLCQRSESEHESSRRLKTEFLVQLDGVGTGEDDRILIIGATNRPQELDEAARRRLVKRLYIPLPELEARVQILNNLIKSERHSLTVSDIHRIGDMTDGYSGADMKTLCHEASMGPIRSIPFSQIEFIDTNDVRALNVTDFMNALNRVKSSVSPSDLNQYIIWDKTYGSGGAGLSER